MYIKKLLYYRRTLHMMEMDEIKGKLSVIGTTGCDDFLKEVDTWLKTWQLTSDTSIIKPQYIRFGTGEAKVVINDSMRNHDVYIYADMFNHGATFTSTVERIL